MKPGVQKPHCKASSDMNALCTGCSLSAPTPSTVVTVLPATAPAGSRQLVTGTPSSRTVHAPQTPAPQTSLVPVRPRPSRSISINSVSGLSRSISRRPLIVTVFIAAADSVTWFTSMLHDPVDEIPQPMPADALDLWHRRAPHGTP